MRKLLSLMVAIIMILGLAGFALAFEIHHPAKKDRDGQVSKDGKSIGKAYINQYILEGATSDTNELTVGTVDPSADNTILFPDESGTLLTTGGLTGVIPLSDAKIFIGNSGGLGIEQTMSGDGSITNAGVFSIEAGTDAQMLVYNAGDGWGPDTMSGDATISNAFVLTIGANKIGTAEANVNTVTILFRGAGQATNTATVTSGSTILGFYPFANVTAEIVNSVSITTTTLTMTLAANHKAEQEVLYKVIVLEP